MTSPNDSESIAWESRPVAEEKWTKTALLLSLLVAFPCAIGMVYAEAAWGWLSAVLLVGSMAPYFSNHSFRLDPNGVRRRLGLWTTRKPWHDFGRAVKIPGGVFLGCDIRPHRLDAFRGLYLRCDDALAENVLDYARRYIEKANALETDQS